MKRRGGHLREWVKRVVFGPQNFAQQCPVGLRDPQSEVTVELRGMGAPIDVTHRNLMACGFPFTVGIGLDGHPKFAGDKKLSLCFLESGRLLGQIGLAWTASVPAASNTLCLFQPRSYDNYCLPKPWLWSRYLYYSRFRSSPQTAEMPLTALELRSMYVFYICPRPVVLATVCEGTAGNVFPLNLMGSICGEYFSFALNSTRPVTTVVERCGRITLSSIPVEQSSVAVQLGTNHRHEHVDLAKLPFATRQSPFSTAPVPKFALRVRELQIASTHKIGSHTLLVARTLHDERLADGAEFFVVHGIYQAWKQRSRREGSPVHAANSPALDTH